MRQLAALLWLVCFCGFANAHEITFSQIEMRLEKAETTFKIQLPVKALLHEQPPLLPATTNPDSLAVSPLSLDVQAALRNLVTMRVHISHGNHSLPLTITGVQFTGTDIAVVATTTAIAGAFILEANLFPQDTLHKLFVSIYRGPKLAGQYALDHQNFSLTLAAPERPVREVISTFVVEGIHHIFIGPDHILFVIALILLGGAVWSQAKIITAFTVAHSITLTLATLNIVQLPSRTVESVIALSIIIVGLHDLRQLKNGATLEKAYDPRIAFAFLFGLVHGFGFASVLAELDLPHYALAWSLAAFNIGVELGQIAIIMVAAPFLLALRHFTPHRVSQTILIGLAGLVVLTGLVWFLQRAFGL
jgi:hydrogenase/urease accessory protein HupE